MKKCGVSLIYLIVILFLIACVMVPCVSAAVWNVSRNPLAGTYNVTSLIAINGELVAGDTIRIWGEAGYVCEGGIRVDAANVTIKQWEGSPVRPVITNHAGHSAINLSESAHNATLQGLNISGNYKVGDGAGALALCPVHHWNGCSRHTGVQTAE